MFRRIYVLVVGAVLTGFAALLVTGRYINDGPILISIVDGHGIHEGDLFVIGGWGVAMTALLLLATSRRSVVSP